MAAPEIRITFPGNKRVDADFGSLTISTDQKKISGGDESAPEPYNLFLASIGTCAGYYVLAFLQARGIPEEGVSLIQRHEFSEPGHRLEKVELEIRIPPDFPEKYLGALPMAVNACSVKKAIVSPPAFSVKSVRTAD